MSENYQDDVKAFWFSQFKSLGNGDVILDLATGNGAVATLAMEYSELAAKDFTVLASDAAEINEKLVNDSQVLIRYREKVKFYSSTPCEQLPFEDSSVDLICSQYGIEYSHLPESIPEICRVLRDGGKFAAILHNQESVVVIDNTQYRSILMDALHEQKILGILQQYFNALGETVDAATLQVARRKPEALAYEKNLGSVVSLLRTKYPGSDTIENLLGSIDRFTVANINSPEQERSDNLKGLQDSFKQTIERQNDLNNAALSQDEMLNLQSLATQSGLKDFTYEKKMTPSDKLTGWIVKAHM